MKVRLKQVREKQGLTQEELAALVGTTHATIQRYETNKRQIPSRKVFLLAAALKCHPGEIFAPMSPEGSPAGRAAEIAARLSERDAAAWLEVGETILRGRDESHRKKDPPSDERQRPLRAARR